MDRPLKIQMINEKEQEEVRKLVNRPNFFSEVLQKTDPNDILDDFDDTEEKVARRESIMSSFKDSEISEGKKNTIPVPSTSYQIGRKIQTSMMCDQTTTRQVYGCDSSYQPAYERQDIVVLSEETMHPKNEESKIVILSRIDHVNTQHNESKVSEMELEMLLNMTDDFPQSVEPARVQKSCKNMSMKSSFHKHLSGVGGCGTTGASKILEIFKLAPEV